MQLQIHCPHCSSQLTVPEDAAGRAARCPRCEKKFRIPSNEELLEDSVSCWLEGVAPGAGEPSIDEDPAQLNAKPKPAAKAADPAAKAEEEQRKRLKIAADGKPKYRVRSAIKTTQPRPVDPEEEKYSKPVEPPKPRTPRIADQPRGPEEEVRLEVDDVTPAGVHVSFSARMMGRGAFRASMPMCCIVCLTTDTDQLSARPLAWIDKATGKSADPGQIEATYEVDVKSRQTAREVVDGMRPIDELNPPFNQPMPYYICGGCATKVKYVHAQAVSTPDGVTCEVQIPNPPYALRWLGRVNGVCGDDYERLEAQVVAYTDSNWRGVEEQVRQRLTAWFDFQPGEQYLDYFPDSDFARKDAGLAGIVLTDRRLVYCKYHAHGSIALDAAGGAIRVEPDGAFDEIVYAHDGHVRKLVRLRRADTERLVEAVSMADAELDVQVG